MAKTAIRNTKFLGRRLGAPLAVLITGGLVSGCSQVPDAFNPAQWYNNTVEFFSSEEDANGRPVSRSGSAQAPAQDAKEFPKLASVDQQRKNAEARSSGLVADVKGRKYAPAATGQGEPVNALNSEPSAQPNISTAEVIQPKAEAVQTPAPAPKTEPETARVVSAPPVPAPVPTASPEVAAAPATATPSAQPVTSENSEHDDFRGRLAKRLAEIRAEAVRSQQMTAMQVPVALSTGYNTIVVSSNGIEGNYGGQPSALRSAPPVDTELTYSEQGAQPLGYGALKVATIRFANGSSQLSSHDRQILANVIRLQKERGGRIRVIGHASSRTRDLDPVKHKMTNFQVSEARANAVAKGLVRMGADERVIQIDAVSDSAPMYSEVMPTGEAGNRRAEIFIEG